MFIPVIFAAAERENDELLALLDVQERAKYEESKTSGLHNNYNTFSSSEVIWSCHGCILLLSHIMVEVQSINLKVVG